MMVHSGIQLFHTCFSIFLHITWVLVSVSYWSPVPRTWAGWKTPEHINQTTEAVFLTSIFIGLLWRCSFNMLILCWCMSHWRIQTWRDDILYPHMVIDHIHLCPKKCQQQNAFVPKKWFAMVCPCLSKNCIPQFQYIPIIHSLVHHSNSSSWHFSVYVYIYI